MRLENAVAADVLERILSAYGFTMQKELSDKLGIAKSNVASWLQRGQVPGNVLVQCALDTGVDVKWLVEGEFANANNATVILNDLSESVDSKELIRKMLSTGGKAVLKRIMDAYGFTTQKQLSEHLGISTGTISTWIRREYFPGDVVIACALDTGASLEWLAIGKQNSTDIQAEISSEKNQFRKIEKKKLSAGKLVDDGFYYFDNSFLSKDVISPVFIESASKSWLADFGRKNISNGRWVIDIDGNFDVYDVARIPGNKINIAGKASTFECNVEEVAPLGVVVKTIENNI